MDRLAPFKGHVQAERRITWGERDCVRTDEEHLRDLQGLLTNQITDIAGYIRSVKGKKAREELKRFTRQMHEGDELWEYEWTGTIGPRDSYAAGWCVVRDKQVVASYCAHSS